MKKLTLNDIAGIAAVNKSTVSKVINNYSDISSETREKILSVIREYNYYPLESAQMLGRGRDDAIAFVSNRTTAHFTALVLRSIEDRARDLGKYVHDIIPYSSFYDKKIADDLFKRILYGRKASVVMFFAMNPAPGILLKYKKAGVPVILTENRMKNAHSVNTGNRKGGYMAAEYLVKSGRKKIGLICGGLDARTKYGYSYVAAERKAGFEEALKKYGIEPDAGYMEQACNYSIREGVGLYYNYLKRNVKLDAVFCASGDMTAMGVIESAEKRGIKIPQDLAVIGYDDSYYAAYLTPALTSVRQPIKKLGAEVFDLALAAKNGKLDSFKHIEIEPELVKRQSA